MYSFFGQSPNHKTLPVISGITHNRACLDWKTKPWAAQFHSDVIQRFEVRSGDRGYSGDAGNGNERSELVTTDQSDQGLLYDFNEERWLSFGFMVETGASITAPFSIVGQVHDFHDSGDSVGLSPPLCFVLGTTTGNTVNYSIQTRYDANPSTSVNPGSTTRWSQTINRDQWYNVVCRMVFGYSNDAQLQLWFDGEEKINLTGINMGFNHSTGGEAGYWQYGIYRGSSADTLAVRYANMEQTTIGNTLLTRVTVPLAIPGN